MQVGNVFFPVGTEVAESVKSASFNAFKYSLEVELLRVVRLHIRMWEMFRNVRGPLLTLENWGYIFKQ